MIPPPAIAYGKLANTNMLSDAWWVLYRGYSNVRNLQFLHFAFFEILLVKYHLNMIPSYFTIQPHC